MVEIEKLAEYMHEVWSNWFEHMKDVFVRYYVLGDEHAGKTIGRWVRQSQTDYAELSEDDKHKDRKFAREIIELWRSW